MQNGRVIRDKNRPGILVINGDQQKGVFVNNICDNTDIPPECNSLPKSLFYFTYFVGQKTPKCITLLDIRENEQIRIPDVDNPDKGFTITPKNPQNLFKLIVICNSKINYPVYSTSLDPFNVAQFTVESKFSCGEINESAKDLDNQKILTSLILIIFGLFILTVAGTAFKKFMLVIAGIVLFVFIIFVIFTYFGFKLTGYASSFIIGGAATISLFINFIVKKVKELFNALTTLLTVKIGYTYGEILFPNSPIQERVI